MSIRKEAGVPPDAGGKGRRTWDISAINAKKSKL